MINQESFIIILSTIVFFFNVLLFTKKRRCKKHHVNMPICKIPPPPKRFSNQIKFEESSKNRVAMLESLSKSISLISDTQIARDDMTNCIKQEVLLIIKAQNEALAK